MHSTVYRVHPVAGVAGRAVVMDRLDRFVKSVVIARRARAKPDDGNKSRKARLRSDRPARARQITSSINIR